MNYLVTKKSRVNITGEEIKICTDLPGCSIIGRNDVYDLVSDDIGDGFTLLIGDTSIKVEPRRTETQVEKRLGEVVADYLKLQRILMDHNLWEHALKGFGVWPRQWTNPSHLRPVVARAREFAVKAHGSQQYGDKPYVYHLDAVAAIVAKYGEFHQVVAYLHDVVEDTATTLADVREHFGLAVANAVSYLTDPPSGTRFLKKLRANLKLRSTNNPVVLRVKAADRLANVREGGKLPKYFEEHSEFRFAVCRPQLCNEIWLELEDRMVRFALGESA